MAGCAACTVNQTASQFFQNLPKNAAPCASTIGAGVFAADIAVTAVAGKNISQQIAEPTLLRFFFIFVGKGLLGLTCHAFEQ